MCNSITFGLFLKSSLFDNLNRVVARFNIDSYGVLKYFELTKNTIVFTKTGFITCKGF